MNYGYKLVCIEQVRIVSFSLKGQMDSRDITRDMLKYIGEYTVVLLFNVH